LYMAGQVNGTSGYEEAGGQGIVAGANAAARIRDMEPLILGRADAYIGVMIDDLVSTVLDEPYRMLTSRAEYRLILRSDTADARLAALAYERELIGTDRAEAIADEKAGSQALVSSLEKIWLGNNDRHAAALDAEGLAPATRSMSALELARRPGAPLDAVIRALGRLGFWTDQVPTGLLLDRTEVAIKYGSFIDKEEREASRQLRSGGEQLPPDLDYSLVPGLRVEAIQRLQIASPLTVGQAARTAGVTPSDIGALLIHLTRDRNRTTRDPDHHCHRDPVTPGYRVR
ncbi:MAG TPA: FAD-dependent oxidoreductase, partial [Thermomicrobiales bacterium]|nr:FAD-dependent oxidoreductase [Thermomicrobiales bacterium]